MKSPSPPRWAERFLSWFCRAEILEETLGDLYELFELRSVEKNERVAKRRFVWDVLRSFRLSTIKIPHLYIFSAMFQNHLKIAVRNISRHKIYSAIKVAGFALGIACCLLLLLYVNHEMSYDRHVPDAERIYKACHYFHVGDNEGMGSATPPALGPTMKTDFPEVEMAGRLNPYFNDAGTNLFRKLGAAENTYEEGFVYADQEWVDLFALTFAKGDPATALLEPNTLVISSKMAAKHFGSANPIGEVVILNDNEERPYKITGVLDIQPSTSHFEFDYYLSMEGLENSRSSSWIYNNYYTYIKLKPGASPEALEAKRAQFSETYYGPEYAEQIALDLSVGNKDGNFVGFALQPLLDIHLNSAEIDPQLKPVGDIQYIWLFSAIAFAILIIAMINFINLATARSANRAREVGIRKTLGSVRKQLIYQFLLESILLSILSVTIAVFLATSCLEGFNSVTGLNITMPFDQFWFWSVLVGGTVLIGVLSGIYPAFVLSAFSPIDTLKGKLSMGGKSSTLRSTLVVFQFATSIVLIISTILVYRQMSFIQNKDLGFDKDQVLIIHDSYILEDQAATLQQKIQEFPETKSATLTSFLPVSGFGYNGSSFRPAGKEGIEERVGDVQHWYVDEQYFETLGINLVEGRNFDAKMGTDSAAVILNETAARKLGFDQAVGQRIIGLNDQAFNVVGVVEDFHWESLQQDIGPIVLSYGSSNSTITLKASGGEMASLIQKSKAAWTDFAPTQPFRYSFLDERFEEMYEGEQRVGTIFAAFAILAILIACLGMFALAAYLAEQRIKEISIRKVLGASANSVFVLLIKNFMWLIGIAFVIGVPIGWYLMDEWLQRFAYGTTIGPDVFIIAGIIVVLIALATVSYQAIRVATTNPAESLAGE